MQAPNIGATAPPPSEAVLALPVVDAIPAKTLPLTALLPQKWISSTGERVRVQGSPGFLVVYVSVDGEVLAIPLDVAREIGEAISEHARSSAARTLAYLRRRAQ